jgi:hypothetical protein
LKQQVVLRSTFKSHKILVKSHYDGICQGN